MKVRWKNSVALILVCTLAVSCMNSENRENSRLIRQAQLMLETNPDSALTLLDRVNSIRFNDAESAEYNLMRVQAGDNAGMDLENDTEIFPAREYFIRRKDREKAALSCFYAGQVLLAQGKAEEAIVYYLEAKDFAKQIDNDQLRGMIANRIGQANFLLRLYDHSLPYFIQAAKFFRAAGNRKSEIAATIVTGNCYLVENQRDSAFAWYGRAEKLAYSLNDTDMQVAVLQNMGVASRQTGDDARAADLYHAALALANRQDSSQLLSNLANLYIDAGQYDLAFEYNQKALAQLDTAILNSVLLNVYHQMLVIEANRGNNGAKVMNYFSKFMTCLDEILETDEKKTLMYIQRKYDFDKAQDAYSIKKRNYVIAILSALIAALLLMLWALYLRKGTIQRDLTIDNLQLQLNELRKTEKQLQKMKKEKTLEYEERQRNLITHYLQILSRIDLELRNLPKEKMAKIESLIRTTFGKPKIDLWSAVEKLIPEGLTEKIHKMNPELDHTELKICCLSYIHADNSAMSLVLNMMKTSLRTRKSRIKKKLGIEAEKNISEFLDEKLSE